MEQCLETTSNFWRSPSFILAAQRPSVCDLHHALTLKGDSSLLAQTTTYPSQPTGQP